MRFAMFKTKRENTVNIFIKLNYDIDYCFKMAVYMYKLKMYYISVSTKLYKITFLFVFA